MAIYNFSIELHKNYKDKSSKVTKNKIPIMVYDRPIKNDQEIIKNRYAGDDVGCILVCIM